MKFSLDTTTIFPEKDQEIKNAIIYCMDTVEMAMI